MMAPGTSRLEALGGRADVDQQAAIMNHGGGLNQVQHLAAELRRIPVSSMLRSYWLSSTESDNTTPPNRGKTSHVAIGPEV